MTSSIVSSAKAIARLIDKVSLIMGYLAGIWVVFMTAVLFYSVISRRIFNKPLIWDIDFTEIAMVIMVYLGVAYTTQIDGHVAMDAVYQRLNPKTQGKVRIFIDLAIVVFAVISLWLGWRLVFEKWHGQTQAATLPIAPALVMIPIGVALLLLQALVMLTRHTAKAFQTQETSVACEQGK